jgi:hypothetical protein
MIRAFLLTLCLSGFLAVLATCEKQETERFAVDVKRLSTDVHVAIAQHNLVLPFIALENYAYQQQSFSLNRKDDSEHALDAASKLLRDSADPKHPLAFDRLSIVVRTYGWNDFNASQIHVCPLLTREWARSVCDNPWAAIQQSLPADRFKLVDLSRLRIGYDPHFSSPAQCIDDGKPSRPLPKRPGEVAMVCEALVFGGEKGEFQHAVVRIDGNLGALWTVSRARHGLNGETAEAKAKREGKAIAAFVNYALGTNEDFPALHATLCHLRRPGSVDSPKGADCGLSTAQS